MNVDETERGKHTGKNIFELYAVRSAKSQEKGDKMDYYACGIGPEDTVRGVEEWLRIHREPGRQIEMCRYADIVKLYSPVHQLLAIMCEDCSFTLEGQYLDVITYHIQHRKLQALYLYDPAIHREPRADEPVIHRISREPEMVLDEEEESAHPPGQ